MVRMPPNTWVCYIEMRHSRMRTLQSMIGIRWRVTTLGRRIRVRQRIRETVGLYVIIYTYLRCVPWILGGVRTTSLPSHIVDYPPPSTHQRITLLTTLIHQLPTPLHVHDWQSDFESFPFRRHCALDLVRKRHVLRKQTQLFQRRRMVPADVFMTQSITAHSNDAGERNGEWLSGGRDTRE